MDDIIESIADAMVGDHMELMAELKGTQIARESELVRLIALEAENQRLRDGLKALGLRHHYSCEDGWYSCPKSEDGCANDAEGDDCNCGVDNHNELVLALLGDGDKGA